jgi:heat shock protein HslJ/membrane-bound inhibitor of C-type lysozyme
MHRFLYTVTILLPLVVLACAEPGESLSEAGDELSDGDVNLLNTIWRVEDIDQGGVIDMSMITIGFPEEGRLVGNAGCNNYFGSVAVTEDSIDLSPAGITRRACAPALMNQERRFLDALQAVVKFAIDDDTWLVLYDETGTKRTRAIALQTDASTDSSNQNDPLDVALSTSFDFACDDTRMASVRFLGSETVELTFGSNVYQLPRVRAASGARYAAENVSFWNHGDEAMIEVWGTRNTCIRTSEER